MIHDELNAEKIQKRFENMREVAILLHGKNFQKLI